DGVELGAVELEVPGSVLVVGDVDAVAMATDVRIVALADAAAAVVIRRALRAIVLSRQPVYAPAAERVRGTAHGKVEVLLPGERPVWQRIERPHEVEPALRLRVEVAARVTETRSEHARLTVDGSPVPEERVQVDRLGCRPAVLMKHPHHGVHGLQDEAIAGAQSLVWRVDGELVSVVGESLLEEIEALPASIEADRARHPDGGPAQRLRRGQRPHAARIAHQRDTARRGDRSRVRVTR